MFSPPFSFLFFRLFLLLLFVALDGPQRLARRGVGVMFVISICYPIA